MCPLRARRRSYRQKSMEVLVSRCSLSDDKSSFHGKFKENSLMASQPQRGSNLDKVSKQREVQLCKWRLNTMDDRKRPANVSAGSPLPKRTNSSLKGCRFVDTEVPPLIPVGQQAKMIRYNDEIHLSIDICPLMKRIMDTWPVQRLHDLKQLGTAYMVYACATHTRFEHSIGVAHLARELGQRLRLRHPSFGVTNKDILCVTLAGLLRKSSSRVAGCLFFVALSDGSIHFFCR